jgi:hypothetical protein
MATRRSSQSKGGLGVGEFRFDTPQLAAGSFMSMQETTSFEAVSQLANPHLPVISSFQA